MTSLVAAQSPAQDTPAGPPLKLAIALAIGGLLYGSIAGALVTSGRSGAVLGLAVVFLPVAMWKRPQLAPLVLLAAALLVEQVAQNGAAVNVNEAGVGALVFQPHIPITSSIPLFVGLGSLHLEGADLLIITVATIYFVKSAEWGPRWRPRSYVVTAVAGLIALVALGIVNGVIHHGNLRVSLMEARPYVYLASTFFLTAVMIRNRAALHAALWTLVVAIAFKSVQGLYVFMQSRHLQPRPEAVLGHEEAYSFALFIFLVAALRMFGVEGRLRKTATWLLPIVIAADLTNNRRAAWLLLGGGLIVLAAVGYQVLPARRYGIRRVALILVAVSAVYLPAYWNKSGALAQPARAIHSIVSPDMRDQSSDLYRTQENANLKYNIRQGGLMGKGFGVPIDYALPIVNIKTLDPLIEYIPHNGVLYILMRMGWLGSIAMWGLLATGIIAGCRLARCVDREIAVVGAVLAAALVAYALEGATDQGFFFYRIAFITGALLGLAEAGRRMMRTGAIVDSRRAAAPARVRLRGGGQRVVPFEDRGGEGERS